MSQSSLMKVLLCTPYLQDANVVSGGINVWGNNVWNYYNQIKADLSLDIVSYDRFFNVQENSTFLQRSFWGVRDYFRSIKETKEKLKNNGPYDVLHLCSSAQLGLIKDLVVIREAHKHGVKVVLHFHFGRLPEVFSYHSRERWLLKRVIKEADSIAVMDMQSFVTLKNNGCDKACYLPNPLSLTIVNQIEEQRNSIKRNPGKILYVGHVIPTKGVYELVKACIDIDGIELHLVGSISENDRNSLENISKEKNDGDWLKIRGGITHNEVIKEMLSCGIFVLPSYTEGFPNVILEAMACGCPIVATDVGAIPEMLHIGSEYECGICVIPKDVAGLKNAIVRFLEDIDYSRQCGVKAQNRVNDLFIMPKVWEKLVGIWKRSLFK